MRPGSGAPGSSSSNEYVPFATVIEVKLGRGGVTDVQDCTNALEERHLD